MARSYRPAGVAGGRCATPSWGVDPGTAHGAGQDRYVLVAVAPFQQLILESGRETGQGQIQTQSPRHLERDPQILAMKCQAETGRIVVRDDSTAPVGEGPALGRSARERLDELLGIQTGAHSQDDP